MVARPVAEETYAATDEVSMAVPPNAPWTGLNQSGHDPIGRLIP
jgi:hypothetical protein